MDSFSSNLTVSEYTMDSTVYSSHGFLKDPEHVSRAVKWMYILTLPSLMTILWAVWAFVLRLYLLRRYYEKQGIRFVKNLYAVVGAEMRVTTLQEKNKGHDWLYTDHPTNLFGTVRGFTLQLYATSAEVCEELIAKTGKHVDRNTPALFSFGRLSPHAVTFIPMTQRRFKERKINLTSGMKDSKRLYDIVDRQAKETLVRFNAKDGSGTVINILELLNYWTRESSGENIWGKNNINRYLEVLDSNGNLVSLPFMTALNHTFTELRFYAYRFWNRVCFPLAALPLTKESRRLQYNIRLLRKATEDMMTTPEHGAVAATVQKANSAFGIPDRLTRDDLVAGTIAGLDTIKATVMGTLFHLLKPEHMSWRQQILDEINELRETPGDSYVKLSHAPKLNAFILESMRWEPPGSLINNSATEDFDLTVGGQQYKIKSGTRIVTCIHALHQNEESWSNRVSSDMAPVSEFDPSRFLGRADQISGSFCYMPFGKGPRRCPGQGAGILMVKVFIANFLSHNSKCWIAIPEKQSKDVTWFHINSKASFDIHCDD